MCLVELDLMDILADSIHPHIRIGSLAFPLYWEIKQSLCEQI